MDLGHQLCLNLRLHWNFFPGNENLRKFKFATSDMHYCPHRGRKVTLVRTRSIDRLDLSERSFLDAKRPAAEKALWSRPDALQRTLEQLQPVALHRVDWAPEVQLMPNVVVVLEVQVALSQAEENIAFLAWSMVKRFWRNAACLLNTSPQQQSLLDDESSHFAQEFSYFPMKHRAKQKKFQVVPGKWFPGIGAQVVSSFQGKELLFCRLPKTIINNPIHCFCSNLVEKERSKSRTWRRLFRSSAIASLFLHVETQYCGNSSYSFDFFLTFLFLQDLWLNSAAVSNFEPGWMTQWSTQNTSKCALNHRDLSMLT